MLVCALLGLTTGAGNALAESIGPGFDLFTSKPGSLVVVGGETVQLQSLPIGTLNGVALGDTDTIVERIGSPKTITPGGTVTFDLQLRALSLASVNPINVLGTLFNARVISGDLIGGPTNLVQTNGISITERSTGGGGTFTSTLPVTANLIFTQVGNPSNTFTLPFPHFELVPFTGIPGLWSFTPPTPLYPVVGMFPSGGFFAATSPDGGPQENPPLTEGFPVPPAIPVVIHPVNPSMIPEPSSIALLASGVLVVGIVGFGKRRVSKRV